MLDSRKCCKALFPPNFTAPVSGKLREILDNDTTTRNKPPLKVLEMKKVEYVGVSMMMKIVMKVAHDYTVFSHGTPRPQNNVNSQDRMIVVGTGVNLET